MESNRYHSDLLEVYNNLTQFNENLPIGVVYNENLRSIVMTQNSTLVSLPLLNYYCMSISKIRKKTVLLPEDYAMMMNQLRTLILSKVLTDEMVLINPEKYGFTVYSIANYEPMKVARIRIISSNSLLFRWLANIRFSKII